MTSEVLYAAVYLVGVAVALAVMRDPWPTRVATAMVWPLGPIAFVVVIAIQLAAAIYLWPVRVLGVISAIAALIWAVGC